ncbi:MAG TPA: four-carbon acid sugar kinase family protein [Streptosporangiaceae bacterium]|nr:four-carbon acid sugar kinase family protein [Streptosporangiaceae bacterium]
MFAGLPPARPDDHTLRASVRALRAADGLLLGVLDDDPTGSQAVHGLEVVTALEQAAYQAALAGPAGACFVLTNTRSLDGPAAARLTARAARDLLAVAQRRGARIQLVSRSDSTLRGHVLAEVAAVQAARREVLGHGFDGVLLIPAFIEAGRVTAADIHWARTGPGLVAVGETEFARDPVFGYRASDLREFIAERSSGAIRPDQVASISLDDIRLGGPDQVAGRLARVSGGGWVVVNATEYSDLDTVAYGVLLAQRAGQAFLFRTGPSFVRALAGQDAQPPLRGARLWPGGAGRAGQPGLIVVGSHVGRTSRQLAALRARGGTAGIELNVPAVLDGAPGVTATTARQAAAALRHSDVLLYTSRAVVAGRDPADSLAIARTVSAALAAVVRDIVASDTGGRDTLGPRPGWIVAKGGITSHDVAVQGLGIRRAVVAGQLFPGLISVFHPAEAAPAAAGLPYVVFAGNVGDDGTLAQVVDILNRAREDA